MWVKRDKVRYAPGKGLKEERRCVGLDGVKTIQWFSLKENGRPNFKWYLE